MSLAEIDAELAMLNQRLDPTFEQQAATDEPALPPTASGAPLHRSSSAAASDMLLALAEDAQEERPAATETELPSPAPAPSLLPPGPAPQPDLPSPAPVPATRHEGQAAEEVWSSESIADSVEMYSGSESSDDDYDFEWGSGS